MPLMPLSTLHTHPRRFRWGLTGLFLLALALRFWRLGQFNELVFDEIYYVRFAVDYLNGTPFFDAHPPLGKYLITLGIVLFNPLAAALGLPGNTLAGEWLSPLSYRWVTALAGACLSPLTALLAYHLSSGYPQRQRVMFGLIAGGLLLLEGLTLVESRFGLINIYWVLFGLVGQVCLLKAQDSRQGWRWRVLAGIGFGSAIAVKWNAAGFLLGVYLLWGLSHWPLSQGHRGFSTRATEESPSPPTRVSLVPPALAQLTLTELLVYCGLIPLGVYSLLWLPHLKLVGTSFVGIHELLWQAHQRIGTQANAHPYCSAWYTWPLLLRPVAYFYRRVGELPPSDIEGAVTNSIYAVQGLGNPLFWWLSSAAIVAWVGRGVSGWWQEFSNSAGKRESLDGVAVFWLVNYGANWLPWLLVSRCTFLYHYMGALVFSSGAIAWLLTRWLTQPRLGIRRSALLLVGLMVLSFLFWLPIYVGLPLSAEALSWRWWLRSWI
ncbi:MAG TPA: phospholipid carrier-dependent glycosyltransferase [Trichocoleus sp.]